MTHFSTASRCRFSSILRPACAFLIISAVWSGVVKAGAAEAPSTPQPVIGVIQPGSSSLPLRLPAPATRSAGNDPTATAIQHKLARYPTTAGYRRLAERFVQLQMFPQAAKAYRNEAALYRKKGLVDAALLQERRAARYETTVRVNVERQVNASEIKALYTGVRLEPKIGCYVGAFIDRDDQLRQVVRGDQGRMHRRPDEFSHLVGKRHATYFTYVRYGQNLPRRWLELCKREKAIPHIAWEPSSLHAVQNDVYLQSWAKALREYDWPVFIRFAGEMNGKWTPYHDNPSLYRAKFRLVHQVLRHQSPKVATIWCVNSVPSATIANYYPGDDGCDWVGINLYSVPFYDNDPRRPALGDTPLPLLDPVYRMYASRKPIAICEYGASHMAEWDRVRRNDFAIEQMSQVYGALPRLYPRIKMINWFDSNNLQHARPGRQLNNYNLTEQPSILSAYRQLVAAPYFLESVDIVNTQASNTGQDSNLKEAENLPPLPRPIRAGQTLTVPLRLSIWVRTYVSRPSVYLAVDGRVVYASKQIGPHAIDFTEQQASQWDWKARGASEHLLTTYVYDDNRRLLYSQSFKVLQSP